uniref:FYVE-type domain-containing protein n=1 Tax=Oryza punctata TaxID=4537 RepID=A0A0E0JUD2_ORYPU
MGDKQATLRMARQELEDLYLGLGVPDESVDLTFKDLPSASASTNIFAYKLQQDDEQLVVVPEAPAGLRLSPSPSSAVVADRRVRDRANYKRRPGIPHSNLCALCNSYIYLFRHRCLVCGRVYCRRCVGAGMGEMTEGRKCIDCLGRRYSHRYIHRAGTNLTASACCTTCFWGYYPDAQAVKVQELVWAEKGPAPRRRPRQSSSSSASYSYAGTSSASTNMTMSIENSAGFHSTRHVLASASTTPTSSSFLVSSSNPHAFPL